MPDLHLPVWAAATHFLNILLLTLLARSGIEVLRALPKLYLSDHCRPGREACRDRLVGETGCGCGWP
jgi:hypothetical protein